MVRACFVRPSSKLDADTQLALALSESEAAASSSSSSSSAPVGVVCRGSGGCNSPASGLAAVSQMPKKEDDPHGLVGVEFKKKYPGYGNVLWDVRVDAYKGNDSYTIVALEDGHRSSMKAREIVKTLSDLPPVSGMVSSKCKREALAQERKKEKAIGDQRKSKRARKSRFIKVDGHTILRENNYGLEQGISTLSGSNLREKQRKLERVTGVRSAFIFFGQEYRKQHGSRKGQAAEIGDAWKKLNSSEKARYNRMSADDRIRYEKEVAQNAAKSQALQEAEAIRRAAAEEAERDEEEAARSRAIAQKAKRKMKKQKTATLSTERTKVATHNAHMKREIKTAKQRRCALFSLPDVKSALVPFVLRKSMAAIQSCAEADATGETKKHVVSVMNGKGPSRFEEQPSWLCGDVTLREYQMEGIDWLVKMHHLGMSSILADEMGLGKTIQTICFLTHLKLDLKLKGPSLIIVPLSVLDNWMAEFKRFSPTMRCVKLHNSDAAEREYMRKELIKDIDSYDIIITTYEMAKSKNLRHALASQTIWQYVVLDEGHKIKNELSDISIQAAKIRSRGRIILTGTPLQNNLHELWALLRYLCPDVFAEEGSAEIFDKAFDLTHNLVDDDTLDKAHYLLRLFQLRRTKAEVELTMPDKKELKVLTSFSDAQNFWAKQLLLRDSKLLMQVENEMVGTGLDHEDDGNSERAVDAWKKLNSLLMQLRKICNHPWLMPGAEDDFDGSTTEEIVEASGKMKLLDRMLKKLFEGGHRVVLFSQFTSMLDILEDYLNMRGYEYVRLDGQTNRYRRRINIDRFNAHNSKLFIFLMSTRAGGLGINAQTADTVVLFDSDWNPQVDLQAMGRVHRIGQKKKVHIYRLVSRGSVEERIIARAEKKLYLDKMVNRDSTRQAMEMEKLGIKEVMKLLRFGANAVFNAAANGASSKELSDQDIVRMIDRDDNGWACENEEAEARFEAATVSLAEFNPEQAPLAIRSHAEAKNIQRQSLVEISQSWNLEKRKRQSRILEINGHRILRENNYTMQEGGISAAVSSRKKTKKKGPSWVSTGECLICWDGGKLMCCDHCPAVYHEGCLHSQGLVSTSSAFGNMYKCPQHACHVCGRVASQSGGMLLRCTECPKAFCEHHEPENVSFECGGVNERFRDAGYPHSSSRYYIQCSPECRKFHEDRTAKSVEYAVKEHLRLHPPEKKEKSSKMSVEPSFPPPTELARRSLGRIIDYDGARWFIAKNNQTPGKIANFLKMDPRILCKQNAAISGLSQSSKLHGGTSLLIGAGTSKRVDNAPVYTKMVVVDYDDEEEEEEEDEEDEDEDEDEEDEEVEPVKGKKWGKCQRAIIEAVATLDERGSSLDSIKSAVNFYRAPGGWSTLLSSLISGGALIVANNGKFKLGTPSITSRAKAAGVKRPAVFKPPKFASTYQSLIVKAIAKLRERGGSSLYKIKSVLRLSKDKNRFLNKAIRVLVTNGTIIQTRGKYKLAVPIKSKVRRAACNENQSSNFPLFY